jgi:transglutaminase-like putative cysteine protease
MSAESELLSFFTYEHLPPRLQEVSRRFAELAAEVARALPSNREKTVALRKLLEAKHCAVRAVLLGDVS